MERLPSIQDLKQQLAEADTDAARLAALRVLESRGAELPCGEAEANARQAAALARNTRSYNDMVRAAIALSEACRDTGGADLWKECADIVREAAVASGSLVHEGQHLYLLGRAHEVQGNHELARDCYERCLKAFRKTEFAGCVGAALNQLANLASIRGQPAEALEHYQECLKIDDDLHDIANGALHQLNVGEALQRLGRLDDALESYFRVLALSEQHPEVRQMRPVALSALGELFLDRNNTAQAIDILTMVMGAGDQTEVPLHILNETTASLGLAYHRQGNHASAHQAYAKALALAEEFGDRRLAAIVISRMAELALDMGQLERCSELAERSATGARQVGLPCEEAQVMRVMALLHAARGEDVEARGCFEKALALLCDLEDSVDMARVRLHYGRYLLTRGERESATMNLRASSRALRKLGVIAEWYEVNRLLLVQELQVDSDAALLQGISGLAALGFGPRALLERALGLLLETLRFDSAAIVAGGRPLLMLGSPNVASALAVGAGEQKVVADTVLSWPVYHNSSMLGRIYLERVVPVSSGRSYLVLDAIANLLASPMLRFLDLAVGVTEGRPELTKLRYRGVVSKNRRMLEVLASVCVAADRDVPVLTCGENGTGKEVTARALHDSGSRAGKPFIVVNCAGVSDDLLKVEFFGTEAVGSGSRTYKGKFETADGGTLFLDEVGDLGPELQAGITRVLKEKVLNRVGGHVGINVDVRVVAATSRVLGELVAQGRFRRDLYDMLRTIELVIPPLRERQEDIPDLVRYIIRRSNQEFGRSVADVSPDALLQLVTFRWPGNVRELEYVVERTVLLARGDTIRQEDLPASIHPQQA